MYYAVIIAAGLNNNPFCAVRCVPTQVAESIINMSRRPEEHVSLAENLELLRVHSNLTIKPYIPSLSALMGRDAEGDTQNRNRRMVVRTEIRLGGLVPTRQATV